MQNKLPLEYGPREAEILRSLTEARKLPSKNEGFRRGIIAVDYLIDADRGLLFEILSTLLTRASDCAKDKNVDHPALLQKIEAAKTLASEIVATFAVQKGIESADSIDIFRADLDNYLLLLKQKKNVKEIDREELAKRLSLLSDMANQFAKKEFESRKETYAISIDGSMK
jgi:hypothetical protein